jgi:hypothetical protein
MRSRLIVALALVMGCTGSGAPQQAQGEPFHLLLAGSVDLSGAAAAVARTDPEGLFREVRIAARRADLAIVTSAQVGATELLADAGFDVVGDLPPGPARLMASILGVLLSGDSSATGRLAEVLADESGVIAYRVGRVAHADFRVHVTGWDLPAGDAALVGGTWWGLARAVTPVPVRPPPGDTPFPAGELTVAALGDVTGDGADDLVAAYRHPFRNTALSETFPGAVGVDSRGRSAHLGVFTPGGEALWAAGMIPRPVGAVAACDGSVALAYTELDDPGVTATGAAVWQGFGLRAVPDLPGDGTPGCADVDGDGHLDPVILERSI